MAEDDGKGSGEGGALRLFGQAASSLGNLGLWFLNASRPGGESSQPGWAAALVEQYRQIFGDLSDLVRGILERVGQVADVSSGNRLLFRARAPWDATNLSVAEQDLHDFVRHIDEILARRQHAGSATTSPVVAQAQPDAPCVVVSVALYRRMKADPDTGSAMKDWQRYGDLLDALLDHEDRRDLPRLLEEVRHRVRADRVEGVRVLKESLAWLLAGGDTTEKIYRLLDRLDDFLGERCAREYLRRRAIKSLLAVDESGDGWLQRLRICFASFGIRLGDQLSVLTAGTAPRRELVVLDHQHDRWFELRFTRDARIERSEWEVYGASEGLEYRTDNCEFRLPLRVQDASQGLAAWSVDKRPVQDMIDALPNAKRLDLRTWDTGANRTPLALMFVHYREGDVGSYYELGLACFVAPRRDPLSVGAYMLGTILVSSKRAHDVGKEIWGYDKVHVDEASWEVRYRRNYVYCSVALPGATVYLRVPRGGTVCMPSAVPILSYTHKPARASAADRHHPGGQWHRAVLTRFSPRDCVRSAGDGVFLQVGIGDPGKAWRHPLLNTLRGVGLVDAQGHAHEAPLHCAWTERMSAHLGPPVLVPLPGQDYD